MQWMPSRHGCILGGVSIPGKMLHCAHVEESFYVHPVSVCSSESNAMQGSKSKAGPAGLCPPTLSGKGEHCVRPFFPRSPVPCHGSSPNPPSLGPLPHDGKQPSIWPVSSLPSVPGTPPTPCSLLIGGQAGIVFSPIYSGWGFCMKADVQC